MRFTYSRSCNICKSEANTISTRTHADALPPRLPAKRFVVDRPVRSVADDAAPAETFRRRAPPRTARALQHQAPPGVQPTAGVQLAANLG